MKKFIILLFLPFLTLATGKQLYQQHCEKCHGIAGIGSIGVPLTPAKVAKFSDDYIQKTIKFGRPGRVMPSFELDKNATDDIIRHLRQNYPTPRYNNIKIQGDSKNGLQLYQKNCASCHGKDLAGGVGVGKNYSWDKKLKVSPPALGNAGFLKSVSNGQLKEVIKNSYPNSEMPKFKNTLTNKQVNDVIAYIRSFTTNTHKIEPQKEDLSFIFPSKHNLSTTVELLQSAIKAANFRVYEPRKLLQDLDKKAKNSKQIVLRFCNFEQMLKFIKIEPRLGIVLPCRITVIEDYNNQVKVVVENYRKTVRKFNNAQIDKAASELIDGLSELIKEALW